MVCRNLVLLVHIFSSCLPLDCGLVRCDTPCQMHSTGSHIRSDFISASAFCWKGSTHTRGGSGSRSYRVAVWFSQLHITVAAVSLLHAIIDTVSVNRPSSGTR
jgi:hypothetical protein